MQNAKKAFTLIEALVSVAIIAIGFAGVYALVSTSSRVMSDSIDKEKLKFQNQDFSNLRDQLFSKLTKNIKHK